jgi:hypothetical protein
MSILAKPSELQRPFGVLVRKRIHLSNTEDDVVVRGIVVRPRCSSGSHIIAPFNLSFNTLYSSFTAAWSGDAMERTGKFAKRIRSVLARLSTSVLLRPLADV